MKRTIAIVLLTISAATEATCYQVFQDNKLIYQDDRPPFDISLTPEPSIALVESRARGEQLVFFEQNCELPTWQAPDSAPQTHRAAGVTLPAPAARGTSANYSHVSPGHSRTRQDGTKRTAGTDIHVSAYTRKDGTYVKEHSRSKPRQ